MTVITLASGDGGIGAPGVSRSVIPGRTSIIPVVTALGMASGQLIAGSVVVETVFSRSGIGLLTVKAVLFQDTPIVLVAVLFAATVFVSVNLVVDILYPFIDPRIDIGNRRSGRGRARA